MQRLNICSCIILEFRFNNPVFLVILMVQIYVIYKIETFIYQEMILN